MLPIVIRTTDEMLRLVPSELREGSYALGFAQGADDPHGGAAERGARHRERRAARGGPCRRVRPRPCSSPSASSSETNWSLFNGPNTALSHQIFRNAASPFPGAQDRAWGAALTLILIVFIFTVLARLATAFFARRQAA